MTPIHIDFAENRQWRLIWMSALLVCLAMISAVAWRGLEARQVLQRQRQGIDKLQTKVQQLKAPKVVKLDPQQQSKSQATKLLNMDLNGMFAAVESMNLPGVRLNGIAFDASANKVRLDYELDTLGKAAQVTEFLNAGDESKPWKMESVVAIAPSPSLGIGPMGGVLIPSHMNSGFKAIWTLVRVK